MSNVHQTWNLSIQQQMISQMTPWLVSLDICCFKEGRLASCIYLSNFHIRLSYYPIFPPPPDVSSEVNLDVSHSDGVRIIDDEGTVDYAPDVLILPSRLKQFAKVNSDFSSINEVQADSCQTKVVHSTTTINPSFVNRGTYAVISIAPRSNGTPKERTKAEILKIEAPVPAAPSAAPGATAPASNATSS
jgi:DNA polymerase alpha subunit B